MKQIPKQDTEEVSGGAIVPDRIVRIDMPSPLPMPIPGPTNPRPDFPPSPFPNPIPTLDK